MIRSTSLTNKSVKLQCKFTFLIVPLSKEILIITGLGFLDSITCTDIKLIQDEPLWDCSQMEEGGAGKKALYLKSVTQIRQRLNLAQL